MDDLLSYEYICKLDELPEGSRRCFALPSSQRGLLLIRLDGQVYCLDQACYHHGGPLVNGDIEEIGGKRTIKCPWHAYQIAIETGEGLYKGVDMAMDPATKKLVKSAPKIKSKGVKQRTHFVRIENGADVYVADSSLVPGCATIESDIYALKPTEIPPRQERGQVKIHSSMQ